MCVNFNCIFFRKSMQLDLNKNNKKPFPRQNFVQIKGAIQNGAHDGNRTRVFSLGS